MTLQQLTIQFPRPPCRSFEGCRGDGWVYDLSDSGSGRTVYCDCEAGRILQELENRKLEK